MTNDNTSGPRRAGEHTGPEDPEELREDIEQTRADLGDTVEALAGKADVKARVREGAGKAAGTVTAQARHTYQAARDKTGPVAQQAQRKARELATKARATATSDEARPQVRGGGGALAAAGAAVLFWLWLRRRRRARRMSHRLINRLPDRRQAMRTARQTGARVGDELRGRAAELGTTVRDSEITAQAAARGQAAATELAARARQAADTPEARHRAQGAAAGAAALFVLGCLRRSRAARRQSRCQDRGQIGGP
jgi:hypothetical protein